MVESKAKKEREIKDLNQEIGDLQREQLELADQIVNIDNHLTVTNQEKRKLDKEYKEYKAIIAMKERPQRGQPSQPKNKKKSK